MTLSNLLSERAREIPGKTFIKFRKSKLTYLRADNLASLVSGGLRRHGLNIKDRAAIIMENCPEYIISYFAILRAGGIAVPVNTFLVAEEMIYILRDSGCKIVIYGNNFKNHVEKIKKGIPGIKSLMFDEIPQQMAEPYIGNDDEVAVFLYTSGTTGFPKGAMLTNFNLISNVEACLKVILFSRKDRVLLFLPLFHSFTFTICVLVPVYTGASMVLLESVKPFSGVINSIFRDRITLFVAVPTVYNILVRKRLPFFFKYIFKSLVCIRACISGASALPEDTLSAFEKRFNIPLLEGYGLTEASPVVSVNPLGDTRKPSSVGPPLPGIEVAVIGRDGKRLASGETGELIVKGPNIMKGYFNKEQETAEVLKEGWFYTGDMAKTDEDDYIYIVDRKKDLIIVDGMNIYPREIENAAMKLNSIEECAMVGIPDSKGSEITMLFVKKKGNAVLDEKEIRNYLKTCVAPFKIPKRIIFVEEFPKTATGKIKKNELRKQFLI